MGHLKESIETCAQEQAPRWTLVCSPAQGDSLPSSRERGTNITASVFISMAEGCSCWCFLLGASGDILQASRSLAKKPLGRRTPDACNETYGTPGRIT